jgi:hypothetical protein
MFPMEPLYARFERNNAQGANARKWKRAQAGVELDGQNRMPISKFGPFAGAFEKGELTVPGHLELLNLHGPGADVVIDRIQLALLTEEPRRWVDALFDDPNWRAHLVGAIAILLDGGARLDTVAMWRALDSGSWVTPQLVVTAYFADPVFPEHLIERVKRRCEVTVPSALSPVERHSATGPGGTVHRSAKLLVSLLSMGKRLPALSSFLQQASAEPDLAALLEKDIDNAAAITDSWCTQVITHFATRQHVLIPRAI